MENTDLCMEAHSPGDLDEMLAGSSPLTDEAMEKVSGGILGTPFYRFEVGEIVYNGRNDPRDFKAPILNRRPTAGGDRAIYEADFIGRKGDRLGRGWFDGRSFVRECDYPRPW